MLRLRLSQVRAACLNRIANTTDAKKSMADFFSAKANCQDPNEQVKATRIKATACGAARKAMYRYRLRACIAARIAFLAALGAFVLSAFFESSLLSMLSIFVTATAAVVQVVFWRAEASTKEVSHD